MDQLDYKQMVESIVETLEKFAADNEYNQIAGYKLIILLKENMITNGIPIALAESAVSNMSIDIPPDFDATEPELFCRIVTAFSTILINLYYSVVDDFSDPSVIFVNTASSFSINID